MNEDPNLADEDRGLYPKYRAIDLERSPNYKNSYAYTALKIEGLPMQEVTEPFFLLKFSDTFARDALMVYAAACVSRYPQLAADIRQKLEETIDDVKKLPRRLNDL